jgi:hypothetical protein
MAPRGASKKRWQTIARAHESSMAMSSNAAKTAAASIEISKRNRSGKRHKHRGMAA